MVITARRGVILATGGFTQSPSLLRTFAPRWADAVAMGGDRNTGDGLVMAMACGAQLSDMGYIEGTFGGDHAAWQHGGADDFRVLRRDRAGGVIHEYRLVV